MTLAVVCWRWGPLFGPEYVNNLRSMLERNLRIDHQLHCITDDFDGIDPRVLCIPLPTEFAGSFRCRRRMWQYSRARRPLFGPRMLALDLDIVIVRDITHIIARPEPIVCWRVGYANVFSGSFLLADTGALHDAYERFRDRGESYLKATGERNASDQALLNLHLRDKRVGEWTERDGFVTFFGDGYERHEHRGVGPNSPELPEGAAIVVLGSGDKRHMDARAFPWIEEHWR